MNLFILICVVVVFVVLFFINLLYQISRAKLTVFLSDRWRRLLL